MPNDQTIDKNHPYLQMDDEYINPVLQRVAHIVAKRAKGSYIYDMNDEAYLDFSCGVAVNNIGHCHPKVVAAVQKQVAELIHTSVSVHPLKYIELAKKLSEIAPGDLSSVFLSNSGAEAVEGAVKMARYVTGRPGIINFRGGFHGRTLLTTALTTSKLYYREKYEPFPPSIYTAPFPYTYRSPYRGDEAACLEECMQQIDILFQQLIAPEFVAAFLVEPIQGEGGFVVPPKDFLGRLRKLADKHGILLIIDEVQTGFCRTGKMFASEHFDVVPDIMLMAKAIAGGMPLSGFISTKKITKEWPPGRHGSTFGGNPVSCAAALAAIEVLQEEKLADRAAKLGKEMLRSLRDFAKGKAHIGEVRGMGLMIGIDFDDKDGGPGKDIAAKVVRKCIKEKLIVLTAGAQGQVIRLIPPLTMSEEEAEKGMKILQKCLTI